VVQYDDWQHFLCSQASETNKQIFNTNCNEMYNLHISLSLYLTL
jgi:hypothetical protein